MQPVALPFDWVERHTAGAVRQGLSLDDLLQRSLIRPPLGDGRDAVGPVQRILLCMNTTLALEDATHGLGRRGVDAAYPAIGLRMALGCATLEGAIGALSRLYAMASSAVAIRLDTEGEAAILSVGMQAQDERDGAYLEENFLVWTFIQCLYFLGGALPVSVVTLRDPHHFSLGAPHWAIGGQARFAEVTSLRFPRHLLARPPAVRAGEHVLWDVHQPWLAFLGALPAAATAGRDRAPAAGRFLRGDGFVRFADLARDAGRSPNTLRRHLQAEGGDGFREARRRALAQAAAERLGAGRDSVEAVAADLGYSDARSLRRFVKAATGLTPQQLRRRGAPQPDDAEALQQLHVLAARMNV